MEKQYMNDLIDVDKHLQMILRLLDDGETMKTQMTDTVQGARTILRTIFKRLADAEFQRGTDAFKRYADIQTKLDRMDCADIKNG
jgi:hypothetical protein